MTCYFPEINHSCGWLRLKHDPLLRSVHIQPEPIKPNSMLRSKNITFLGGFQKIATSYKYLTCINYLIFDIFYLMTLKIISFGLAVAFQSSK